MDREAIRDAIAKDLLVERIEKGRTAATPSVVATNEAQGRLRRALREVGESGDLDEILETEKGLLAHALRYYANSSAMETSLGNALTDLAIAQRLLPKVREPQEYRIVDELYSRTASRRGDVPLDEARQFFTGHRRRLQDWDKAELNDSEKRTLRVRVTNLNAAERMYIALQREALGREPSRSRETPGIER